MDATPYCSAQKLATAIQKKEISSKEAVNACLERINHVNLKLNAVVQIAAQQALKAAENADDALAEGKISGPLHGLPMTIKDSLDTAGIISTGGTLGRKSYIPSQDAAVVARLRAAGAILLGKTNTPEFTLSYETDNLVYGQTRNPYHLSYSPGGSSGGAAAIVSAGGSAFDIGSDYGGSLRYPSHCCGITTIKPTSGRVPRTGHILPFGGLLDSFQQIGPMARCVQDLQMILPLIIGPDGIDPSIVPMPMGNPETVDLKSLRFTFHTDNGIVSPDSDTRKVICNAAAILEKDGMKIVEARPAGIEQAHDIAQGLWAADGGASIERLLKEAGTQEHTIPWLGMAPPLEAAELDALIVRWYRFRSTMLSFFNHHDLIICPVNAYPAQPHGTLGKDLQAFSYTSAYNLTGWPAAVIRGGTSSGGLPIGVQIIAKPWREDVALAVAAHLEAALGPFPCPGLSVAAKASSS